jgi:hypothetical protein
MLNTSTPEKTRPETTSARQWTHGMSSFDWAQDQCSDIECDVLKLEKIHIRNKYTCIYTMWDWLSVNSIKRIHYMLR